MTVAASPIRLADVSVNYAGQPALEGISGAFAPGTVTAVIGPNGAGKSTLLRAIAGLVPTHGGNIMRAVMPKAIAYLPQAADISRDFPISVRDAVLFGAWRRHGWRDGVDAATQQAADAALDTVGLAALADRRIGALSVGQFQRAMFARLILQDAPVMLLDEPFAAVDITAKADLMRIVTQDWPAAGRTVVMVLHDLDDVRSHVPQTLLLARRVVAWGPTASVITAAALAQAQTLSQGWAAADLPTNAASRAA